MNLSTYQEKALPMKQVDLRGMHGQEGLQKCLHINHCGISWLLLSNPSTSSDVTIPENTDNPEPGGQEDIQIEYSSD